MPRPGRERGGPWGGKPSALAILVPGYPQWTWRQRGRGLVLLGSYLSAMAVGLFGWGTTIGLAALSFAYAAHVGSVLDVIRQRTFPGFGRWVPLFSASGGLGLGLYLPALTMATLFAWPGANGRASREGFAVDCRAYRSGMPREGEWVWLRSSRWGDDRLGRVVAGPGQEVECSDDRILVDGRPGAPPGLEWHAGFPTMSLSFTVPRDHVLVVPATPGTPGSPRGGPKLVARGEILGRAWAQLYPIRSRRLLP